MTRPNVRRGSANQGGIQRAVTSCEWLWWGLSWCWLSGCRPATQDATPSPATTVAPPAAAATERDDGDRAADTNSTATNWIGQVVSSGRPVPAAVVRRQGQRAFVMTDAQGRFRLPRDTPDKNTSPASATVHLTASREGYLIGGREVTTTATTASIVIELQPLPTADNPDYAWVAPQADPQGEFNCANCHPAIYAEWAGSAHARSANSRHFRNLYDGSTWQSDDERSGWNLLHELPEGAGVCVACHAPSASLDELGVADMRDLHGVTRQGVHCDFCHKVQRVAVPEFGLTHGRFAVDLLRPHEGQLFFGSLDDVDRGEDSVSSAQRSSEFCATCHEGTVFGVPVYSTYREWQASDAARRGIGCRECHLRPTGQLHNLAPGHGGLDRDPTTLANHRLFPDDQRTLLRDAIDIDMRWEAAAAPAVAIVSLSTRNVGHRVPTGFIDRHLILVVDAVDGGGQPIPSVDSHLPTATGDLAGKAGVLFAKRWLAADNDQMPTPFWRSGGRIVDTRLLPDTQAEFRFEFPSKPHTVNVKLIYRRFWYQTAQEKHWPDVSTIIWEKSYAWPTNPTSPTRPATTGSSDHPSR